MNFGDALVGMVTERDLVRRIMALRQDLAETCACNAMLTCLVFCYEDDDAASVSKVMPDMHFPSWAAYTFK